MPQCKCCDFTTTRCAIQESFLDQKWLIDFLDGAAFFSYCNSYRVQADWAAIELLNDGKQDSLIHLIESMLIDLKRFEREVCNCFCDPAIAFYLSKISRTA